MIWKSGMVASEKHDLNRLTSLFAIIYLIRPLKIVGEARVKTNFQHGKEIFAIPPNECATERRCCTICDD